MHRLLILILMCVSCKLSAWEISGYAGIESLGFVHNPIDGSQHNHYLSGVIETDFYHDWDDGRQSFTFVPYYRFSQHDNRRTHFDIRELTWLKASEQWELRVGIRKLFWGVTESQHLVDIINQRDIVENFDGEDKLGQPMINFALIQDWGTLDFFLLTGFRERTFSGKDGRMRPFPEIDVGNARYEKHGIDKHMAYAMRWSHTIGDWDLGLSHFYGTNREPTLLAEADGSGQLRIIPYYEMIHQTAIDVQATTDSWLWKLEAMVRSGQGKTYFAATGGIEYSFYNVQNSGMDIGIVAEYLYDSRGQSLLTIFQDDIMMALRFGFNDVQSTEILAGVIFDRTNNAKFYNIEASRRLGDSWKIEVEARFFSGTQKKDPAYLFRHDDHIRAELSYHF